MKIDYSQKTNFQAVPLTKATIGSLVQETGKYLPKEAVVVKLDPHDIYDLWALSGIKYGWQDDKFAMNIYENAYSIYKGKSDPKYQVYAITTQRDNFDRLNADEILGVGDLLRLTKRDVYISNLQVKPEIEYSTKPKYKGVKEAIIESLKETCTKIKLISEPEYSHRRFYKKLGFFPYTDSETKLMWKKSN